MPKTLERILAVPVYAFLYLLTNPARTIILAAFAIMVGFVADPLAIRLLGLAGGAALLATLPTAFRNYKRGNDRETLPNKVASLASITALWANLVYDLRPAETTKFYFMLAIGAVVIVGNIYALVNDFLFIRTVKRDGDVAVAKRMIQKNLDDNSDGNAVDFDAARAAWSREAAGLGERTAFHHDFFEGAHRDERLRQLERQQEHDEMLADACERHG